MSHEKPIKPLFRWKPEEDDMLRRLITVEHVSFSVAADKLAAAFKDSQVEFTRNACISRAHRLQLQGRVRFPDTRAERQKNKDDPERKARREPSKPRLALVPPPTERPRQPRRPVVPRPVEFVDGTCQFMPGMGFEKCGKPHDGKTNWCEYHRRLCYDLK